MEDILARHRRRAVPRYTSYPTAPHFEANFPAATYEAWLAAVDPAAGGAVGEYVNADAARHDAIDTRPYPALQHADVLVRRDRPREIEAFLVVQRRRRTRSSW